MSSLTDEQVRDEAVKAARELGWNVDPAQCRVVGIEDDTWHATGHYDRWRVILPISPAQNTHRPLSRPQVLTGDVQLYAGGPLCDITEPDAAMRARLKEQDAL